MPTTYSDKSVGVVLVQLRDGEQIVFGQLQLCAAGNQEVKDGCLAGIDIAEVGVGVVDTEGLPGTQAVEDGGERRTHAEQDPELVDGVIGRSSGRASLGVFQEFRVEVLVKVGDAGQTLEQVEAGLVERDDRVAALQWGRGLVDKSGRDGHGRSVYVCVVEGARGDLSRIRLCGGGGKVEEC